jgi:hypothetical protein
MVYAGQLDCYENCHEVLEKYISVKVSASQVHRVTTLYGEQIGKRINEYPILTPAKKDEVLYVQADGSMIFTREQGWKEVKLGRIFKGADCIHADAKKGWISNSQYVAHLGSHKVFTEKMEELLDSYSLPTQPMVFISDGAPWIKNWIEDAYPHAISILDYYHAAEYLHDFSKEHFKENEQGTVWVKRQKELLLESKVRMVLENVKSLKAKCKESKKLIEYYESNIERMDYASYLTIGSGLIGSGAIESAHRTVIQKRMKQSGQRWSKRGAQNMLNLRVTRKNNQWEKIIALTKTEFRKAA